MKKVFAGLLSTALVLVSAGSVWAAAGKIVDSRTLVPVRGAFEELGFNVSWDAETAIATISNDEFTIEIPKGKDYFTINGTSVKPDVPQQIIDGSFYLPLRAVGDSVGAETSWNGEEKVAHISYKGNDSYIYCNGEPVSAPAVTTPATSSVYGRYTAAVDMTDYSLGQSGMSGNYADRIYVYCNLDLAESGTATLSIDKDKTMASIKQFFTNNLAAFLSESMGEKVTEADISEFLKYMGYESKEAFIDDIVKDQGFDELFVSDSGSFTISGNSINLDGDSGTISDGKIVFSGISELAEFGASELVFVKG